MVETNLVGTATVGLRVAVALGEGLAPVPQPTSGASSRVIASWARLIGSRASRRARVRAARVRAPAQGSVAPRSGSACAPPLQQEGASVKLADRDVYPVRSSRGYRARGARRASPGLARAGGRP